MFPVSMSNAPTEVTKLFIEFDGQQLEVLTDIRDVCHFFERTYGPMLVPVLTSRVGRLEVLRNGKGYTIRGTETFEIDEERPVNSFDDYLRHQVLSQFVRARPDLLWIHAAAVERDGKALLLVGPSGQGKSTFSTRLCERGWRLLSDDAAPIRMDTNEVLPFFQAPHRRKPSEREMTASELGIFDKEVVIIPENLLSRNGAVIRAIVFPSFKHGASAEMLSCPPGDAALDLLRNTTNFSDHKEGAVERVARLARMVPVYRLVYGGWQSALRLLDGLE